MTGPEAEKAGVEAAEALEPEVGLLGSLDPLAFGQSFLQIASGLLRNPLGTAAATARLGSGLGQVAAATTALALGSEAGPAIAPDPKDRRFRDPAWRESPFYFGVQQAYLLFERFTHDLLPAAGLDTAGERKARFALQAIVDALAPTNVLAGNPTALKRAFDTGGRSVLRGTRNFLQDVATNEGLPRKVDLRPFTIGKNLAATPGKVVFRNRIMELIQYAPQTDTVYENALLLSPPWINKYYVMDLAPGQSFAEWAVKHGHTVFAISYRNPDESLRDVPLDGYLLDGPKAALDVIQEITGAPQVNMVGLCVGGTLTAMLVAHLAAVGDDRVRSATLLNTLVDFTEAGELIAFTDAATVRNLRRKMARRGYLDSADMARTFTLLRANDLIWNYVVSNWLMGEDPPAFEILAWNDDGMRMPGKMHSFYLETCYLQNQLARGVMELGGTRLDLSQVKGDFYVLSAREDHIAPWLAGYKTPKLVGGQAEFVLTSSGHIAGIVNPPSPKRSYWKARNGLPDDPGQFLVDAEEHKGSWWEDWARWAESRGGARRDPPPLGSEKHPPLEDAPGTYVREK